MPDSLKNLVTELDRIATSYRDVAAGVPSNGPWYYVYLKPKWKLMAWPFKGGEESLEHIKVWEHSVVPQISDHYKIRDPKVLRELVNCPYSMPRGRAVFLDFKGKPKQWVCYWGDDLPKRLNLQAEKRRILGEFNLTAVHFQQVGGVKFIFDQHETMMSSNKATIQKYLGPIPY